MKKYKRLTPECFENCMVGLFHDEEDELCKGNIKGFEVGPDLPTLELVQALEHELEASMDANLLVRLKTLGTFKF